MIEAGHRQRLAPDYLGDVALAWLFASIVLVLVSLRSIWTGAMPDPDDFLRLVEVRDLIGGQGWFDLTQHRAAAATGGVPMHWSRLVDVPLAGAILVLRPLLGQPLAEQVALIAVPLATLGAVMLLVSRIAWRLLGEEAARYSSLALLVAVSALEQLRPLRIDHHGWQMVALLVAVNGLMARSPRVGGWTVGAALAVGLSISLEGLPVAAAIVGLTALRWLRNQADRAWTVHTMLSLASISGVLFLATRGLGDVAVHCDAVSPVHLAVLGFGAVAVSALAALGRRPLPLVYAGFAAIAVSALAIALRLAPQCAGGAFAGMDPLTLDLWYHRIDEGLPLWHQRLPHALQLIAGPVLGLLAAMRLARESRDWARRWWIDYALLLGAALLTTLLVARAGAAAGVLAAPPLGWQLRRWFLKIRKLEDPKRIALAYGGMIGAIIPAAPAMLIGAAAPVHAEDRVRQLEAEAETQSCQVNDTPAALARLPRGTVLAPLDIGPPLLARTGHGVVATGHHRGHAAMHDVIAAFLSRDDHAARAVVRKYGVDYLVFCPSQAEILYYRYQTRRNFAASLAEGRAPAWLRQIELPGMGAFRAWRVVTPPAS